MDVQELARWVEEHKLHICHDVTVDDLNHLHRGGRVSKATAVVGTMVKIKPIIYMDNNGKLQVVGKERGRQKIPEQNRGYGCGTGKRMGK